MLNVLIVDDEPLARESVAMLLNNRSNIGQVFQAGSGNEALLLVAQHEIHLAFLDMQMPGMSGLRLARELPDSCVRVFITAYDQFALPAFEVNAVDYLLKPFSDERFAQAMHKVSEQFKLHSVAATQPQAEATSSAIDTEADGYRQRLVVRDPGRIRLIDVDSVNYITGAGNYVELHLDDGKVVLHRETMTALEQQLDPQSFTRIHRSSIVRRTFVKELRPNDKGDYTVILASGDCLTLSRRNRDKIEALTG
jgi:two-component system LytT family response regulator